nr:hypothetical protein [Clostridioides sp.]
MFRKEFFSGEWFMVISNELYIDDDSTYCKFDMIKHRNDYWGCPINQIGTIKEVLDTLKSWKKIDEESEYNNIDMIKMEEKFISILENEL